MSSSCDAHLVYGIPCPSDLWERLGKLGYDHLDMWLEEQGFRPATQVNAGRSNGGSPWFLIGVELSSLRDYTRGNGFAPVKRLEPTLKEKTAVIRAAMALELLDVPKLYLVGDVS